MVPRKKCTEIELQPVKSVLEINECRMYHIVCVCVCVCVYSAGQTPRRVRQHCSGEAMDVFCSQCSKKVNLLQDLEARLKTVKANRLDMIINTHRLKYNTVTQH